MLTYFIIFISKIIENTLSTLRLIVVAKGKKMFGAILQFIIAFVWVITTGIVVVNIKDDPLKVVFFALGSLIGSYLGSFIEEKIALGEDMLTVITNDNSSDEIIEKLSSYNYPVYKLKSENKNTFILLVMSHKKNRSKIINIIKKIDKNSLISASSIKNMTYNEEK